MLSLILWLKDSEFEIQSSFEKEQRSNKTKHEALTLLSGKIG
jgi:hypothetical protein